MSFKVEVIADDSGVWSGNAVFLATEDEAESYARDLSRRWLLVRRTRVVQTDDPANYQFISGQLEPVTS